MSKATNIISLETKGIVFFGDVHFERIAQTEISDILEEITEIASENKCDTIIQLGDFCDKARLDADELYHLTQDCYKLVKKFKYLGIIEGNHDKQEKNMAVINYLEFLGINIHPDELLLKTPFGKMLVGHWFVDKSKDAFGTHHKYTVEQLNKKYKYDFGLLGHQHDFQKLTKTLFHLGSARYVNFGESDSITKKIVVLNEHGLKFVELKNVIPIKNVYSIEELNKLDNKTKVRYIFKSFTQLKNDLSKVDKIKDKFYSFKKKIDFTTSTKYTKEDKGKSGKKTQKQIVNEWLNKISDSDIKNILKKEFETEFK